MENTDTKNQSVEARRSFLKKVAYAAPAVVALGALTVPVSAQASVFHGQMYAEPGHILSGSATVTGDSGPGVIQGGTYQKTGSTSVRTFTGAEVASNDMGVFDWARRYFANIM